MIYWKIPPDFATILDLNQDKGPIKRELSEILTKYYDGYFARLVQEYIRTTGMSEEEREALVEAIKIKS